MIKNVYGHHQVISSGQLLDNKQHQSYVIIKISTFVQVGKCYEWFENMEVLFLMNRNKS